MTSKAILIGTSENQTSLHNHNHNNVGTRVRTISGEDRNDVGVSTPKEFADLIHLKDIIYTAVDEETKTNVLYSNADSNNKVNLSHGNSHPQFHTGIYIPLSPADLTLEVHKSSGKKHHHPSKHADKPRKDGRQLQPNQKKLFVSIFYRQALVMSLWFFTSFSTIVLNKYLLSTLDVDASLLGECQILMTTFLGGLMMYLPCCRTSSKKPKHEFFNRYKFYKTISILGWLRCGAVICSVVGLKYVAVSFSETIKSSAPLFTAIMAYFMLGEYSGLFVNLSLMPIMFGLAISTYSEVSFNFTGFIAACTNNLLDCIQNVFSKKLLSGDEMKFSPLELQFYTSVAATVVQMPLWFLFVDISGKFHNVDHYVSMMLLLNGIIFYLQSFFAYTLMSLISPVTFSVSNTVKRAGLIWFSILVFGNKITLLNGFGTVCVVGGVFLYQRARIVEANIREKIKTSLAEKTIA